MGNHFFLPFLGLVFVVFVVFFKRVGSFFFFFWGVLWCFIALLAFVSKGLLEFSMVVLILLGLSMVFLGFS